MVDIILKDHPDFTKRLNNLKNGLSCQYKCIGKMEDLKEAI